MAETLIAAIEVAELLGVSRSYVNRLAAQGQMPEPVAVLPGGARVWQRKAIEKWVEQRGKR